MIEPLPPAALVLETARLRLAPMTMADLDIATRLLGDARVMHYVTATSETPEEVAAHMPPATRRGAGGRIGIWTVTRRDTGERIGDAVLLPVPIDLDDTDWESIVPDRYPGGQIEIGYLFVPEAWGRGFATEACARLMRFAFDHTDLPEIVATTDPENTASQNVLRKCGMRDLGLRRAYGHDNVAWLGITRAEWLRHAGPG